VIGKVTRYWQGHKGALLTLSRLYSLLPQKATGAKIASVDERHQIKFSRLPDNGKEFADHELMGGKLIFILPTPLRARINKWSDT